MADDAAAILRLRRGEAEAFATLYDDHADDVFRFLFRRTASWADAEDLTSEVFLLAWRRRDTVILDPEAGLRPWLFGVAHNLVRNRERAAARRLELPGEDPAEPSGPDVAEDVAARLDQERRMRAVMAAMARLAEPDREILQLCLWEELSPSSAATALGLSPAAARQRLSRARTRLRSLLDDGDPGVVTP